MSRKPAFACCQVAVALVFMVLVAALWGADEPKAALRVWPSEPPADCPFPNSEDITGLAFTGRHAQYTNADTWYPSWASDDKMYSPWTDGEVNGVRSDSYGDHPTTGFATITGNDPMNLTITDVGVYPGDPKPYGGRYPSGSLVHNGVWYYGTYCLMNTPGKNLNWDTLGPFVGLRYSTDFGKTWHDTLHTPSNPLFGEPVKQGEKVRMGAPHFVDFGKNMEHSPDGKAYLVAHGASDPDPKPRDANASWITGDQIFLARVKPSIKSINDRSKYEFYAGENASGKPLWTRHFSKIKPLLEWNNNVGSVTVTYNAPLKKYLMAVTDGGTTISRFNTYILESNEITGPWKLVTYMKNFGEQAYFVNIPSKFISADGRTMWLAYSANFTNGYLKTGYKSDPPGGGYWFTLQEMKLSVAWDQIAGEIVYPSCLPGKGSEFCANTPPRVKVGKPEPHYTKEALQSHTHGQVIVSIIIGKDGRVLAQKLKRSLGHGLDEAVLNAVAQWLFVPAKSKGDPVPVMADVQYKF